MKAQFLTSVVVTAVSVGVARAQDFQNLAPCGVLPIPPPPLPPLPTPSPRRPQDRV